ncbi:hypothetical protein NX774_01060 [Massilia agilis]|uniref:Uncharacterized protein n=1 Tax=Massilia agilis TaxID=1811226 RepID=A0ABT2D5B8_9BURK|nr:hypothetical protein [Massilia agilis]MCS0806512.1 hypothetical protein [Massilia agilis]
MSSYICPEFKFVALPDLAHGALGALDTSSEFQFVALPDLIPSLPLPDLTPSLLPCCAPVAAVTPSLLDLTPSLLALPDLSPSLLDLHHRGKSPGGGRPSS